jgi:hypothetical protein
MDASHLLSVSVTPVVLISASALVTLALYNRLGTILARIRAFHQQKIELFKNLHGHEFVEQQMLIEMLNSQVVGVTGKARVIQKSLYCLLAAIVAFLLCSLFAGATELQEGIGMIALAMALIGLGLFLGGIGLAMWELRLSLTPLEEENAYLEALTARYLARSKGGSNLKIAELS